MFLTFPKFKGHLRTSRFSINSFNIIKKASQQTSHYKWLFFEPRSTKLLTNTFRKICWYCWCRQYAVGERFIKMFL